MPRVKSGVTSRRRKKAVLKRAKGFRGAKSKLYRTATEAVDRSLKYAYRDRKQRKRDFRSLWIVRIGAASNECGLTYSRLINGLKIISCDVNRKMLAEMAVNDLEGFKKLVEKAKEALNTPQAA